MTDIEVPFIEREKRLIAAHQQVAVYCRRATDCCEHADEVVQRTMLRALLALKNLKHTDRLIPWALQIARNEVSRYYSELNRQRLLFSPLPEELPSYAQPTQVMELRSAASSASTLERAVRDAAMLNMLTDDQAKVILARLSCPGPGWEEVATALGREVESCQVIHCRAIPKLRVFLFVHRPEIMGGMESVREAFMRARHSTNNARIDIKSEHPEDKLARQASSMSRSEIEAFQKIVIERMDYRAKGWRTALQSACSKVSVFLER